MTQDHDNLLREARLARRHLDRIARQLERTPGATARQGDAADMARRIGDQRKVRGVYFPAGLFGEPAWDLILALYMAQAEGEEIHSYALFRAAGVAPSTGLRLLEKLEAASMIARSPSESDRRQVLVRFTEATFEQMTDMLSRMHRA